MPNEQFNMSEADETGSPFAPGTAASGTNMEDMSSPTTRKTFRIQSNLVLAGMFIAGLVTVYLLSLRDGPKKASAQQIEVERKVNVALEAMKGPPPRRGETGKLINTFYYEVRQRQIPIGDLSGNPFTFVPASPKPSSLKPTVRPANSQAAPDAKPERAEAMKAVSALKLESVLMGGRRTMAMISNNLLAKGQRIRGWTIVEIRPRQVVLKWRNETYVLKMPE